MTLEEAKRDFRNHLRARLYGIWDRVIEQIVNDAAKIFSRVTPADSGRVTTETLSDAWDFLNALRGEWSWKKDEPRAGNQADYEHLCRVIEALRPVVCDAGARQRIAELPDEPAVMTGCMNAAQAECDAEKPDPWTGEQSLMGVATADQPPRTSDDAEMALRRVLAAHSESIVREACRIFGNIRPDVEPDSEREIALPPLPSSRCQGHVVQSSVRPPFEIELNEADMETARETERLRSLLESQKCPECGRHRPHCDCLTAEREAREKSERDCECAIKDRDEAEEALGKIYREVTGKQAVWSSNFGYSECIDLVEQAVWAKEQELGRHIQAREAAAKAFAESQAEAQEQEHRAITWQRRAEQAEREHDEAISEAARIAELERLNLEAQHRIADLIVLSGDIDQCRCVEGDSITILCDNPEDDDIEKQAAVEACGGYTDYEPQRFYGRTWSEALHKAANAARRVYAEDDDGQ